MTIDALEYLTDKYNLNLDDKPPIQIVAEGKFVGREHILPEIFKMLGFTIGVEVGIEKGIYSALLCEKVPGLKLYSIDPWKVYNGYREHITQNRMEQLYENAQRRLEPYNCEIIRKYSMDAVKDFEDGALDFVYIDSNHDFQHITNDIVEWAKKVRIGGIVSGHDYRGFNRGNKPHRAFQPHVKYVVQAYTRALGIRPWFIVMGNKSPSWFWIKGNDN